MCGPAALAIGATVAGGIVQAMGQARAGLAEQDRQEYLAAVDRNNARRAEYLAEDAIDRGRVEESRQRLRGRLLIGQMRAVLAGSGQVIDEGSAGDLVVDQAAVNEEEARTIRNQAQRDAQEFRLRAGDLESSAELRVAAGEDARTGGRISAAGSLLGTAGTVANRWYQFQRVGAT